MESEDGSRLFGEFMSSLMSGMMGADTVGEEKEDTPNLDSMMTMLGSFTVLRLTSLMGAAQVQLTKEQLLDLNSQLNQVEKAN